jgi:hypothetical protein
MSPQLRAFRCLEIELRAAELDRLHRVERRAGHILDNPGVSGFTEEAENF